MTGFDYIFLIPEKREIPLSSYWGKRQERQCVQCKNPATHGSMCETHAEKNKMRLREYRAKISSQQKPKNQVT